MVGAAARGRRPSAGPASPIQARVLGGFEVTVAGRVVSRAAWQRVSAERLVKLLLVTPGHRVTREAAAEILWPDAAPQASRANLRKAVYFAHDALGSGDALVVDVRSVGFEPDRLDLDLDRLQEAFRVLSTGSATSGQDGRLAELDRATEVVLDLGSRELLPDDPYEDWLFAPRERLRSRWQTVALTAARHAHESGRTSEAHELAGRLLDRDPTDEAAHRLAIELYAAEGRHHAARRQLELCRAALRENLDVDPSPETEALLRAAVAKAERAGTEPPVPRLIARREELQQIEPLLDRVAAGHLAALVIRGPAGIGKSRLLREVVSYARAAGWSATEWQAVEATRSLAYGPFRIGLAGTIGPEELAQLEEPASSGIATVIPSLGVRPRLAFAERPALVSALVTALGRLAAIRPAVIAVDDLPWLDRASLETLGAVVSGLPNAPILLATTYRDDEPTGEAPAALVDQIRRAGGLELTLGPLAPRDVEPLLLGHLGGESIEPRLARLAHEHSAGNPLFCLELLRAARDHGRVRLDGGRWAIASGSVADEIPDSVRRLVAGRASALPGPARDLLAAVAELGAGVSFDTLAAMLPDPPGGLVAVLDAALDSGLLVERGTGYAFAHPLFRLVVRGSVPPGRRGAFHLAAARALASVGPEASVEDLCVAAAASADPAGIADHALAACELGIEGAVPLAVAFGFEGGDREARVFDHGAAIGLLERALAAWRRLPPGDASAYRASAACARLGAQYLLRGDETAATAACRNAIDAARTPEELVQAYVALRYISYRHGDFEAGLSVLAEGMARLPPDATAMRARLQAEIGWSLARLRRLPEALEALAGTAGILEDLGDRPGAMTALDALGVLLRMLGRVEESIVQLERSLTLALELHDSRGELYARIHLVGSLTSAGHPARARPHAERSLELARMMGDRYLESVAAWKAAEMSDSLGDTEAAAGLRRHELDLLAGIGGNAHNEALAHAHLAVLLGRAGDPAAVGEARAARELARRSEESGYPERIGRVLALGDWNALEG